MKSNKYKYQITIVINPKIDEKDRDGVLKKVEEWLKAEGVETMKNSHFGVKELVYEIRKMRKGDFWIYEVESQKPIRLKTLNLSLNRETSIIRYLILKN